MREFWNLAVLDFKVSWMSQSVCDRGIALVREKIVEAWHLRQDTALEKSFGQLVSMWLKHFESSSDERHRIVVVLENDRHRSALQRLQCLRLCSGETGVPHRTGVLQYCPNHRDVEVQQVITPGARLFQLLEEVQSRCSLRRDGVDMLRPFQVTRNMYAQQLESRDAFNECATQVDGRWRVLD